MGLTLRLFPKYLPDVILVPLSAFLVLHSALVSYCCIRALLFQAFHGKLAGHCLFSFLNSSL